MLVCWMVIGIAFGGLCGFIAGMAADVYGLTFGVSLLLALSYINYRVFEPKLDECLS